MSLYHNAAPVAHTFEPCRYLLPDMVMQIALCWSQQGVGRKRDSTLNTCVAGRVELMALEFREGLY